MEPDADFPLNEVGLAGLMAVSDIDERDESEVEALLAALLSAAWPSRTAQDQ